jgi:hypothetical protein
MSYVGRPSWWYNFTNHELQGHGFLKVVDDPNPQKVSIELWGSWSWLPSRLDTCNGRTEEEDCSESTWNSTNPQPDIFEQVAVNGSVCMNTSPHLHFALGPEDPLPSYLFNQSYQIANFVKANSTCIKAGYLHHFNDDFVALFQGTPIVETTQLQVAIPFIIVVVLANLFKVILLYVTIQTSQQDRLLTVGDAVASFLATEDTTLSLPSESNMKSMSRLVAGPRKLRWKSKVQTFRSTLEGSRLGSIVTM